MIQYVKKFSAELELYLFAYRKIAMYGKVPLQGTETPEGIPA